ncbi:hypothetical protein TGVAND_229620 [Toxoplasma gondii VAND]|uniref:Uncharacterized protein n=1 Tax=Toxoplasma gondii VAND TaxID=933077 RepID=A0A086PRS0_TOXGO|nr:hypothetical protein TGVAND_229620 [Toxoplasma gondii VAND]
MNLQREASRLPRGACSAAMKLVSLPGAPRAGGCPRRRRRLQLSQADSPFFAFSPFSRTNPQHAPVKNGQKREVQEAGEESHLAATARTPQATTEHGTLPVRLASSPFQPRSLRRLAMSGFSCAPLATRVESADSVFSPWTSASKAVACSSRAAPHRFFSEVAATVSLPSLGSTLRDRRSRRGSRFFSSLRPECPRLPSSLSSAPSEAPSFLRLRVPCPSPVFAAPSASPLSSWPSSRIAWSTPSPRMSPYAWSSSSPLIAPSNALPQSRRLPALCESRRFFYYRFHKRIGKGNFNRYLEFYQKPRGIENTLRLRYNYTPTFTAKKRSEMWKVNLVKKIAHATDAKQVLDVWTYYRHRRTKRPYHYLLALQRLVEVGGCDPTDFRFRLIARGIYRTAKRFINLPRVCVYLAKLNATGDLQDLSRFLIPQVEAYFPFQLCLLAHAFGSVRLQDKVLFAAIDEALRPHLSELPAAMLVKLTQGYAGALVHNYGLLARVSLLLQQRVSRAATGEADPLTACDEEDETGRTLSSKEPQGGSRQRETAKAAREITEAEDDCLEATEKKTVKRRHSGPLLPTLHHLLAFGRVCADLKYQDFGYLEMLSIQMQAAFRADLAVSSSRETFQRFSPFSVQELVEIFHRLKVNDVSLLLAALRHVQARMHDYPPSCVASIGFCTAQMLPCDASTVRQVHAHMLEVLQEAVPLLDLCSLGQLAAFAKKAKPRRNRSALRSSVFEAVEARVLELQGDGRTVFDVGRLLELLSLNGRRVSEEAFHILCRQAHRHLDLFEPQDFCRLARALARVKCQGSRGEQSEGLQASSLVNALARRTLRQEDEFSPRDFLSLLRSLTLAGPPDRVYAVPLKEKLRRKQVLHNYFPASQSEDAEAFEDSEQLFESDLPPSSRQTPTLRKGRLLLGPQVIRRPQQQGSPESAEGEARSEKETLEEESLSYSPVPDGEQEAEVNVDHAGKSVSVLSEGGRSRIRRRRLEEKLRIAEEEGWDLLHRRVASLRQLKGWL